MRAWLGSDMREYCLSFITGGFALLGVIVSNLFHIQSLKRSQKLNREAVICEKKELLYLKVIKALEIPLENQFISLPKKNDISDDEPFDIEAQMQLYAPRNILSKYHSAMEAVEAMLPQPVKEKRNEDLLIAMKEDLGIKEK